MANIGRQILQNIGCGTLAKALDHAIIHLWGSRLASRLASSLATSLGRGLSRILSCGLIKAQDGCTRLLGGKILGQNR
ncbi:hypothetical protein JCM17846_11000 [Iodidimonas nitroreducens]|uniref:Uncharacterized protein n=1 Tax=Iodidimonas nitroreducens TaxID=1236968 RepID=A0A5A7N5R0_9PROT|nr:hypothetical protein JCM17846_11000 [Iodidimonas nitroreducens]